MPNRRNEAEKIILDGIEALLPGSKNTEIYKTLFSGMNDVQFEEFINRIDDGTNKLAIIAPNMGEPRLSVDRNLALAKEMGHEFFERIWMDEGNGTPKYLSPVKYLVIDLPVRRQAQLLVKKMSVPDDNRSIDDFSGQATGKSAAAAMSYPETQVLAAVGLDESLKELLKYRGGDTKGFNAMNDSISKTGGVSLRTLEHLNTKVKSTNTLGIFLKCMHLDNSL